MFVPVADIISAVEFNHDGELLATGDKGGRVVIFQRNDLTVSHFFSNIFKQVSLESNDGQALERI